VPDVPTPSARGPGGRPRASWRKPNGAPRRPCSSAAGRTRGSGPPAARSRPPTGSGPAGAAGAPDAAAFEPMNAIIDAVVAIDPAGRIVAFNPTAERRFGYSAAEALGREPAALLVPPSCATAIAPASPASAPVVRASFRGRRIEISPSARAASVPGGADDHEDHARRPGTVTGERGRPAASRRTAGMTPPRGSEAEGRAPPRAITLWPVAGHGKRRGVRAPRRVLRSAGSTSGRGTPS
jgi:hypothetical protein